MRDPVTDKEGNTYERAAIEEWILRKGTSPLTRRVLSVTDLVPNRALRDTIVDVVGDDWSIVDVQEAAEELAQVSVADTLETQDPSSVEEEIDVCISAEKETRGILISINPPPGTRRVPVNLVCVIDISGSMDSPANIKTKDSNGNEKVEDTGLTVLDVVKHALKTIVGNMGDSDRLGIVTFSDSARREFELMCMNSEGREAALRVVEGMHTEGSTNLYDGLKKGMEMLSDAGDGNGRMGISSLFLLTDGQPNIEPPRGSAAMLKKYLDEHVVNFTINTFGFGYYLDSVLLDILAVYGGGSYAFIPDAGMVGTVFVHALSNLLVTIANRVRVSVEPMNGTVLKNDGGVLGDHICVPTSWGVDIQPGTIRYGQSKDVLIHAEHVGEAPYLRVTLHYDIWNSQTIITKTYEATNFATTAADKIQVSKHRHRLTAVTILRNGLKNPSDAGKAIEDLLNSIPATASHSTRAIQSLIEDLSKQASFAFRPNWFESWGRHYIPSLSRAHLMQECNNFKDPGVQHYGGELFQRIRDEVDKVFDNLPPATPSRSTYDNATGSYVPPAPVRMTMYNNRDDPCVRGDALVYLKDETLRRVDGLRKGDELRNGAKVVCVVRTKIPSTETMLVDLSGTQPFFITPWHPVRPLSTSAWTFPTNVTEPKATPCDAVYSFLLDEHHVMEICTGKTDYQCVTLGHDFHDPVCEHAFFGSEKVVEHLKTFPGFANGLIETAGVKRNALTELVCGFCRVDEKGVV